MRGRKYYLLRSCVSGKDLLKPTSSTDIQNDDTSQALHHNRTQENLTNSETPDETHWTLVKSNTQTKPSTRSTMTIRTEERGNLNDENLISNLVSRWVDRWKPGRRICKNDLQVTHGMTNDHDPYVTIYSICNNDWSTSNETSLLSVRLCNYSTPVPILFWSHESLLSHRFLLERLLYCNLTLYL